MFIQTKEVFASEANEVNKLISLQNKIAKGYSNKFCNSIGMGISKEGATRLTIAENKDSKFNPSLWFELVSSGKSNLDQINKNELTDEISKTIVNDCGRVLGFSGQQGVDDFKSYFINIRDEMEDPT